VFENGRPTESFALRHGSFSFEQVMGNQSETISQDETQRATSPGGVALDRGKDTETGLTTPSDATPPTAFEESFAALIDYWEDKFDELDGRKVPEEDKEAIIDLLVGTLKERADIE
jgi:hypothetical protein